MKNSNRVVRLIGTAVAALLLVASSEAQFVNRQAARWYAGAVVADSAFRYGTWGGSYGSTAAESYQRGMADIIRSQGQAAEAHARAAVQAEDARSRYIDNQTKWLEEYNRRKRVGLAERQQSQQQRRAAIDRHRSQRAASASADLPIASELDPETGAVNWPNGLTGDEYAAGREVVERLMQQWTEASDPTQVAGELEATIQQMHESLRSRIREIPATDYIAADRFLKGLQSLVTAAA